MKNKAGPFSYTQHFCRSMYPLLQDRDVLEIVSTGSVRSGDIVLFQPDGMKQKVAHRVCKVQAGRIWVKGDNNPVPDETILRINDMQGVVTGRWRKGRKMKVYRGQAGVVQYAAYKTYYRFRLLLRGCLRKITLPGPLVDWLEKIIPCPREVQFVSDGQCARMLYLGKRHIATYSSHSQRWLVRFPYCMIYQNQHLQR